MNCQHWELILFDLARGLQNDQSHDALMHAKECKRCSAELEEQRELSQKLKMLNVVPNHQPAENIPAVLLIAFRDSLSSKKRNRNFFLWARAAVLILAVLGGWMWYRSMESRSQVPNVQSVEYDGEFIPLQYGNHPVNSWQIVRIELESSALQELGFPRVPEWEERPIQADIVVGDDGLPQAIRFVTLNQ
jgi:hypothetical protein